MKGLNLRLMTSLVSATVIGLLIVEIVFVFWLQMQLSQKRSQSLQLVALTVQTWREDPSAQVFATATTRLAADRGVVVTWWDGASVLHQTAPLDLPLERLTSGRTLVAAGYEHLSVADMNHKELVRLVVSAPLESTVRQVMARQPRVLMFLAGVGVLIVGLAFILQRRAVARPIVRMTEIVRQRDKDALSRFETETPDELAQLSRAIMHMTQRSDDDSARIAAQLQELKAAHEHLSSTQRQLVRSERLAVVGQLAAGLAHEIGNPLAILDGYLDLLRRGDIDAAESDEAFDHMAKELQRLQATIRALLDFSRASAGSVARSGEIAEAVAHVRSLVKPQKKLAAVDLQLPEVAPGLFVSVDAQALTQVLVNLILNAADALNGKGIIRVGVAASAGQATIQVDDSGPGIAAELRQKIFDPFFTTKPAGAGTGLGLSICERIITSAGGEIVAEQSDLGGARLRLTLPIVRT